MTRNYVISPVLEKQLEKFKKKDPRLHVAILRKMKEIINSKTVNHYKNLRKPLQNFKRIHITGDKILFFEYDSQEDKIFFYSVKNWDDAY